MFCALFLCVPHENRVLGLLIAGVNEHGVLALLTADRAAPGELAGASLHHLRPARTVPGPTAQQLTAVWGQSRCACGLDWSYKTTLMELAFASLQRSC